MHVLVMAKSPAPGRAKTRLCPPLNLHQAAAVAEAALADSLDAVAGCGADRRILALDGTPGDWIPPGFEVIPQRGASFGQRLAAAWHDVDGPGLQIGMDTPQISPGLLDGCLETACKPGASAALGPAADGGWWAIALVERWNKDVFTGVPMSTPYTGLAQLSRLIACGHRVRRLPVLRDVDLIDDAYQVAALASGSRFARTLQCLEAVAC
jgi:glycosyltransferase A (GT-A) superfamily protein (DUF2064 family)